MSKALMGVRVPHRKGTAALAPVTMPSPASVTIPVSMHIGKPATPVVKVGDKVLVGDKIAEKSGPLSSPVHASISGTVKKIEDMLLSGGTYVPAITIESDGEMTQSDKIAPPTVTNYAEFISAIEESGIVGLGGAGFPTFMKLDVKDTSRISEIIINCAECEPYITSDTRTAIDRTEEIAEGIKLFEKFLDAKKIIVGIEKNKPEAIKKLKKLAEADECVTLKILPSVYPQGAEKVLIYNTTGKVVPVGKLPIDVGCVVCNCTTVAEIARYIKTGMPLTQKCVTVDGDAIAEPKNVIVPIGTGISDLMEFCGGFKKEPKKILCGGPMMGLSVPSGDEPIMKNTNAVLAFGASMASEPAETQCIHCGKCATHCPLGLAPVAIAKAYENGDGAELADLEVNLCMECGCCSFICPAKRPLVQINKLAKGVLREYSQKKKEQEEKAK